MKTERRRVRVRGLLALAATPTFAAMALWSAAFGGAPGTVICSVSPASPLDAMTIMYLLMSVFHLSPWLRRASRRRSVSASGAVSAAPLRVHAPIRLNAPRLTPPPPPPTPISP
jgi:hypothetical protein